MLPSKIIPTSSPSRLTTGLPELPPMMSAVLTKLNGVERLSCPFFCSRLRAARTDPCCRAPRRVRTCRPASWPRVYFAVFRVSLDLAKRQAKREGRIRIDARAIHGEPGVGNLAVRLALGLIHLLFVGLADAARGRVDQFRKLDHGVVRIVDGLQAAIRQLLSNGDVLELGAVNQFRGAFARRFAGEHFFHQLVVRAHDFGHHSQRIGQLHRFEVVVNGRFGK